MTAQTILNSSKLLPDSNIYSIGPFGRSVSFGSQQARAFNLIWALQKENIINSDTSVAVIGIGLSGMTAALTLAAYNCPPEIYEMEDEVLDRQSGAEHRMLHPTINFWPEREINHTTAFPFADWHLQDCSETVEYFQSIWKEHGSQCFIDICNNAVVQLIAPITKGVDEGKILVKRKGGRFRASDRDVEDMHEDNEKSYHVVILATGFGDERNLDLSTHEEHSYWKPDGLEGRIGLPEFKEFLVAGDGDGGLIDCLRILYNSFDNGRITLKIASIVDSDPGGQKVKNIINRAEESAREAFKFYERGKSIPTVNVVALENAYLEAVGELSFSARERIEGFLLENANKSVVIISPSDAPYNISAAPVHKLMLAIAQKRKQVLHVRGRLVKVDSSLISGSDEDQYHVVYLDEAGDIEHKSPGMIILDDSGKTIAIDQGVFSIDEKQEPTGSRVCNWYRISRIGPTFSISNLVENEEIVAILRANQTKHECHTLEDDVLDQLRKKCSRFEFCPDPNQDSNIFHKSRKGIIKEFWGKYVSSTHYPELRRIDKTGEWLLHYDSNHIDQAKAEKIGGISDSQHLFGLKLKSTPTVSGSMGLERPPE